MKRASILFFLCCFISGKSLAEDFEVEANPNVYPPAAFKGKNTKVGTIPARRIRPDAVPDRKTREAAFAAVPDFSTDVAKMDELARDMLFVRAKTKSLKDLEALYPKIEAKKLARLQQETKK